MTALCGARVYTLLELGFGHAVATDGYYLLRLFIHFITTPVWY